MKVRPMNIKNDRMERSYCSSIVDGGLLDIA
jgi:hypothetical protein